MTLDLGRGGKKMYDPTEKEDDTDETWIKIDDV